MDRAAESITGGCYCGKVRYEARAFLKDAYYCHCRMCQRTSGAPAEIAVLVEPGSLHFIAGRPKFHRTSPFGERGFCPECGSRLVWKGVGDSHPEWTNLAIGCLDAPEKVVPTSHQCVESQLPWYQFQDGLPRLRSEDVPGLMEAWTKAPVG